MEPDRNLDHTKHVFRAAVLLCAALVGLVLGRSAFVPESWGQYGSYRGQSVAEYRDLPLQHGGDGACQPCHQDRLAEHTAGGHATVRCELCHAPVSAHVQDDEVIAEMPVQRDADLCLRCHRQLAARPATFPQIQVRQHLEAAEVEYSSTICFECHDPHSPL